jgi:hypothetical protein
MPFIPSPRSILAAFDQVESDLTDFLTRVPLTNEHLSVWSPSLVRCIFDACSQLDSLWKLRDGTGANLDMKDHFSVHKARVADEWLVIWDADGVERRPFSPWSGQTTYLPLRWWQAYNKLKHNRWENVREATLAAAVDAAAALFLAIAVDGECQPVLAERKWFHSQYSLDYVLQKTSHTKWLGITIESRLFSYAVLSSAPDFPNTLAHYNACSRRFGKWLEGKYKLEFWPG